MTQPAAPGLPPAIQAAISELASAPPDNTVPGRVLLPAAAPPAQKPAVQAPTTPPAPEPQGHTAPAEDAPTSGTADTDPAPPAPEEQDKLSRANQAAEKARAGAKRNRELRAQQEMLARQNAEVQAQLAQAQRQAIASQQFEAFARQDPYAAMKALGYTDKQIAERALKEGTPEQQIDAIKHQLDQERHARQQLEANLRAREQMIQRQQNVNEFLRMASNEKTYPNLADVPQDILLAAVNQLADEVRATGQNPGIYDDKDVCEFLDQKFAQHKRQRALRRNGNGAPQNGKPPIKPSSTLTNRDGASKFSAPADFDKLSEEEQMNHLVALARKGFYKDE